MDWHSIMFSINDPTLFSTLHLLFRILGFWKHRVCFVAEKENESFNSSTKYFLLTREQPVLILSPDFIVQLKDPDACKS